MIKKELFFFHSQKRVFKKADNLFISFIKNLKIEILLIDVLADGYIKGFDHKILETLNSSQLLLQGGVLSIMNKLDNKNVLGLAIENRLLWEEQKSIHLRNHNRIFKKRDICL